MQSMYVCSLTCVYSPTYVCPYVRLYTQVLVPDRQFDEFSIVQEEYVVACEVSGVGTRSRLTTLEEL